MKTNLLIAGLVAVAIGTEVASAQTTTDSILTLNANDTPAPIHVVSDDVKIADANAATTPATTSTTATSPMGPPGNDVAFLQLSLTPELALEPRTTIIDGVSIGIWNENPQHGAAFGIINGSTGNSSGFSWGIVNYDDTYKGVQWGVVNYSREYFIGWQRGWVNLANGEFYGFQSSFVNVSRQFTGLQLGIVNYASDLKGVQLGLVNISANSPWFSDFPDKLTPAFPFFNWSF